MYLQGDLQKVFDALYEMGVIDPVLKMDWNQAQGDLQSNWAAFAEVMACANRHQENTKYLASCLAKFDIQTLNFLAMEVAREFADYHTREELH